MVMMVAGYKPKFWPVTLARIEKYRPPDTDVCVVCPGLNNPDLIGICEKNGWSYLSIRENQLSLAQNLAIEYHSKAELIHKLDEDIVIGKDYFTLLEDTREFILRQGIHDVGFVAPTLNVNGFSYRLFLDFINPRLLEEFRNRFGDFKSSCVTTAAWGNPDAAQYLWENSMPFDNRVDAFGARDRGYAVCPHRFSIGAILITRKLWDDMGGFSRAQNGLLGVEEQDLCAYCADSSRIIAVAHQVFAGHIGFGPQTAHMTKWFDLNFKA